MGLTFRRVESALNARLTVRFGETTLTGRKPGLPEAGGQLACATPQGITFDAAERWLLEGEEKPGRVPKAFQFYQVVLHEIGHCIGLLHSSDPADAMWPYYQPEDTKPVLSA